MIEKRSKGVNFKRAKWGQNYGAGVLGGTWSQKKGQIQADQGHQIRVLWIYLISPSIPEILIKYCQYSRHCSWHKEHKSSYQDIYAFCPHSVLNRLVQY